MVVARARLRAAPGPVSHYRLWAEIYVEMLRTFPDLRGYRPLRRIEAAISPTGRVHRDVA